MSQTISLFVDISTGTLVTGLSNSSPVSSSSIPLRYGDTPTLKVYLLDRDPNANLASTNPLKPIALTGLSLELFIDDGAVNTTNIYAQQIAWTVNSDVASAQYFTAQLPLNFSTLLAALVAAGGRLFSATLQVGYVQGGLPTTVLSDTPVTIKAGLPNAISQPPTGQTALSVERANGTYFPLQPVNGQQLVLASPLGKKIILWVEDMADGSAILHTDPV